jgi:hypothetical protein
MDGWWSEVEDEILTCLREHGATSTAVIARRLKMSEAAATSLLAALACEGKLRIETVGLMKMGDSGRPPGPLAGALLGGAPRRGRGAPPRHDPVTGR